MQSRMTALKMSWKFSALLLSTAIVSLMLFVGFNLAEASDLACGAEISGNTTLHQNLNNCDSVGLLIVAKDITLDCDGHTIKGTGLANSQGIAFSNKTGVTVKNCDVRNFLDGFRLDSSGTDAAPNTLMDNTARGNIRIGYLLVSSNYNVLTGNSAGRNGEGYVLDNSGNNTLTNNTANQNGKGFTAGASDNNNFMYNTANSNDSSGFSLENSDSNELMWNTDNLNGQVGFVLGNSSNNELTSNTANHNEGNGIDVFGGGGIF